MGSTSLFRYEKRKYNVNLIINAGMKYFRFVYQVEGNAAEDIKASSDYRNEVGKCCSYLSRMYEYYFSPLRTGNLAGITIYLVGKSQLPELPESCENIKVLTKVIDTDLFARLSAKDKPIYILGLCQQAIMSLVDEMGWNREAFENTYSKIMNQEGCFREHWHKAKTSPDRQMKAQIYFEDDFESDGIYVDFTDRQGRLLNRIRFAPKGYQVHCKSIGEIQWVDNVSVKIQRTFGTGFSDTSDYWTVGVDGSVDYHSPRAEGVGASTHGLFALGTLFWEGSVVFENKRKGLELIKEAARRNYIHAKKWLEQNMENKD